MNYATISGSERLDTGQEVSYLADGDDPEARLAYEANENGYDPTFTCRHCGEEITREGSDDEWRDDAGETFCAEVDEEGMTQRHEPEESSLTHASAWLNSARVAVDGNEVHATISVGDPRSAFCMTVRMHPDGYLIMHVPHPSNEAVVHAALTELHPGTYRIG